MEQAKKQNSTIRIYDVEDEEGLFSLPIVDGSMEPIYNVGEKIIISQKLRLDVGDDVVIDSDDWDSIAFRRYRRGEGNKAIFYPLNNGFETFECSRFEIGSKIKIVGIMFEHIRRPKRRT
jgi:SOS-response transcriptional repressor LexA